MDNLIINRPNYVSESEMVAVFAVALIMKRRRRRVIKPRIWSRSWVLQRQIQGAYANLCRELEVGDMSAFTNFTRLSPVLFHHLEDLVRPLIQKTNTNYRDCISAGERLMITLRFLATGE